MSDTEVVDQVARAGVAEAKASVSAHERECVLRWQKADASMVRVESAINGIISRMWIGMCAVLTVSLSVIGFLAAKLIG